MLVRPQPLQSLCRSLPQAEGCGVGLRIPPKARPWHFRRQRTRPCSQQLRLGHAAGARAALDRGTAVDAVNKPGKTALQKAAQHGHAAVAALLQDRGAAVCAKRTSTALRAASCVHLLAALLLDTGVAVRAADQCGRRRCTTPHCAATRRWRPAAGQGRGRWRGEQLRRDGAADCAEGCEILRKNRRGAAVATGTVSTTFTPLQGLGYPRVP